MSCHAITSPSDAFSAGLGGQAQKSNASDAEHESEAVKALWWFLLNTGTLAQMCSMCCVCTMRILLAADDVSMVAAAGMLPAALLQLM